MMYYFVLYFNIKEFIDIGTSHNRAPMPFNKDVGSSVDYRATKPTNWKDGDYKKWINNSTEQDPGNINNYFFCFSSFVWSF